jgi:DNA polymerase-3 subunit epsilon
MPKDAQGVHGISSAFLTGQPVFEAVVDDFLAFIEDSPLVAHNAVFDFGFVNYELKRAGMKIIPDSRAVCTLELSRKKHPGAKHTLDALCGRYGIDLSQRTKHGALLDAELLAQVYVELLGGRQIGLDLATEIIAETAAPVRTLVEARDHDASDAELLRHAAFIATLKDPVWLS